MTKTTSLFKAVSLVIPLLVSPLCAEKDVPEDPYRAGNQHKRTGQWYKAESAKVPVKLRKDDVSVLVAARGAYDKESSIFHGKSIVGQHAVAGFYSGEDKLTFKVDSPVEADYEISLILASPDQQTIEVTCGDSKITAPSLERTWRDAPRNWRQHLPGTLRLKKGVNEVTFRLPESTVNGDVERKDLPTHLDQLEFMLYSIEFGTPAARKAQIERAAKMKGDSSWMVEGKYGLFVHFSANMYGWQTDDVRAHWFQESVKMFDVKHFANEVERTGAAWIIFTVTHQGFYWPGPSKAVDAVMPGRTTERDLIMEIADELATKNIDTLLYLHTGYNGVTATEWRNALGAEYGSADPSRFNDNVVAILKECSLRYGKKVRGFGYLDGCLMHDYPLDPHWESWAKAIQAGNPDAIVGFSSNQGPTVSPFSSVATRDGGHSLSEANPDLIGPGKQFGDVDPAWWCAMDTWYPYRPLKGEWTTGGPRRKPQDYVDYFVKMDKKNVPVTINICMTADVIKDHDIFDPRCMAVMEEIRKAIRGK